MRFTLSLFCFLLVLPLPLAHAESPPSSKPILRIEPGMHTAAIKRMGVSRDGRLLATGSDDKTVRLWALPAHSKGQNKKPLKPRLIRTLRVPIGPGNGGKINAVALSPNGRTVATGGWDAYVRNNGNNIFIYLFDTVSGALTDRLGPLKNVIFDLSFSHNGKRLAAGLGDYGVRVWHINNRQLLLKSQSFGDIYGLDWDQKGRLATTSYDGFVRLYGPVSDAVSSVPLSPSPMGEGPGSAAGMSECDPVPSTKNDPPHLVPPPPQTKRGEGAKAPPCYKLLAKIKAPGGKRPYGISFSPDGRRLAIGYRDSTNVDVLDGLSLEKRFSLDTNGIDNGDLSKVAWSRDERVLLAAGRDVENNKGIILRWDDLQTGDTNARGKRRALPGPLNTVHDLTPTANGGFLFAAGDPAFGLVTIKDKQALYQGPVTVDMRGKRYEHFTLSSDATKARFGFAYRRKEPHLFDLKRLRLTRTDKTDNSLHQADTTSLPVKDWQNEYYPTLNGKRLKLQQYEISRSLAITPDQKSFVLGADWRLRRYDDKGVLIWEIDVPSAVWGVNLSSDGKIIVAAYGDGTIRWHRMSDGAELLALFVHVPDKRWVLWTPSGYFTSSPGGESLIGWHVNRGWDEAADFFPVSKFRKRFYRPDVVKLMLKTLDEKKALAAADEAAGTKARAIIPLTKSLPPVIDILDPVTSFDRRQLTLRYNLRSPSDLPIVNIGVLIDGRPWKGLGLIPSEQQIRPGERKITIELPPRDVTVQLVARTRLNSSVPATYNLQWLGKKTANADLPRLFALLVGVSDYKANSLDLNYADKDAIALDKVFRAQKGHAYREVATRLLTNEKATRGNILRGLNWLREQANPGDVVIISLSGHGYSDPTQFFHFLPHDVDPGEPTIDGIGSDRLTAMIRRMKARVIVFLDACHAGDGITSSVNISRLTGEMRDVGAIMYAASTGNQLSVESAKWGHGAFTYALLRGLAGKADFIPTPPPGVDTAELNLWLAKSVAELTGNKQQPVMVKGTVPDFVLAVK